MLNLNGIELLPEWPAFLSFALAGLLLNLIPGQDMMFVMVSSARYGRRAGTVAALGIGTGALAHILAAALGVTAILAASPALFVVLKLAGALYLLTIAFSLVARPANPGQDGQRTPERLSRVFRRAVLINLTNPKVALFFWAFIPPFVSRNAAAPALEVLCLGLWFDAVGTLVNLTVALASASVAVRIRGKAGLARGLRLAGGVLLGALAVKLALSNL